MSKQPEEPRKLKPVCRYCGSDDVSCGTQSTWNEETQQWETSSVFDDGYCNGCEQEQKYFDWKDIDDA